MVLACADRDEALAQLDARSRDAHRSGSLFSRSSASTVARLHAARRGDLDEAERGARRSAFDDARAAWGFGADRGTAYAQRAARRACRVERGDLDGARAALTRHRARRRVATARATGCSARLELLLGRGPAEDALAARRRASRPLRLRSATRRGAVAVAQGARRSTALGRRDEALAARRRRSSSCARGVGRARRGRPRAARARHARGRRRDRRLEEAVAVLDGVARAARARQGARRARLGAAARAAGPTDAREPLRRALELADVVRRDGARRARAHRALRHRRAAAHRALSGVERADRDASGASPTLAADGRDEPRHRAGALRDAEDRRGPPLQRYRKLGIRSRRELGRRARRVTSCRPIRARRDATEALAA